MPRSRSKMPRSRLKLPQFCFKMPRSRLKFRRSKPIKKAKSRSKPRLRSRFKPRQSKPQSRTYRGTAKELPMFDNQTSYEEFLTQYTEEQNSNAEFAYLELWDVLLPGCIIKHKKVKEDALKFWSGYAYKLIEYLRSDRDNGLHECLKEGHLRGHGTEKEPPMYVDTQIYECNVSSEGKIRLFSSPFIEVCESSISPGNIIRYKSNWPVEHKKGGIYTHTCPLWIFECPRMRTSGECRLDILAGPDAIHKSFGYSTVPVGFKEERYCAVQLKAEYVLFVYERQQIRKALIDFDFTESINKELIIYKCIAVNAAADKEMIRKLLENTNKEVGS